MSSDSDAGVISEAWLDKVEEKLDRPLRLNAEEILPELEAFGESRSELPARYLLLRGRARYLCDRFDDARVDLEDACSMAGPGCVVGAWACVRLAQLHLACAANDDARHWVSLARDASTEVGCSRLKGEVAVLEGRLLRVAASWDEAETRFTQAEVAFADARCWHRVVSALMFRLAVMTERAVPTPAGDLYRAFIIDAKAWGIGPQEWVSQLVEELTYEAIGRMQPGVVDLLVQLTSEFDPLIPGEERFWVGRALMRGGEIDNARQQLAHAARGSTDTAGAAQFLLAMTEENPAEAGASIRDLIARNRHQTIDPDLLMGVSKDLIDHGFLDESRSLCEHLKQCGDEITDRARVNLAGILLNSGHTGAARELLDAVDPQSLDDDPELHAIFSQNQGLAMWRAGNWEQANELYRFSIERLRAIGDESQLATALSCAAQLALLMDDPGRAVTCLQEVEELDYLSPQASAANQLARGETFWVLGLTDDAIEAYEACLAVADRFGLKFMEATVKIELASILLDVGRAGHADSLALSALKSTQDNPCVRGIARTLRAYASLMSSDRGKAERHFRRAAKDFADGGMLMMEADCWDRVADLRDRPEDRVLFSRRAVRTGSAALLFSNATANRLAVLARIRPFGARLVESLLKARQRRKALAAAYEVKASEFMGLMRGTRRETENVDPDLLRAMTEASMAASVVVADARVNPAVARHLTQEHRDVCPPSFEAFKAFTSARSPAADARIDPARVLSRLRRDEAAVEYFFSREFGRVLIFVSHRGRVRCHRRRWQERHTSAMQMLPDLLQRLSHDGDVELLKRWLRLLHDILVKPLGTLPERVERLWLAPGGLLESVPFEALLDGDGRPLIERVETTRLPTTAQLALMPRKRPAIRSALVLRGCDEHQAELHHADHECAEVSEIARGAGVALADSVDEHTLSSLNLLHYAGHASFEIDSPAPGKIFLAGREVSARDLIDIRLDARPTVVLSACKSGRTETGSDEFGGFLRAFFAAGAIDLVCSGWLAVDATTRETMKFFYEELLIRNERPSAALRAACLAVRTKRPHPFYWANFRCYGLG